MYLWLGCNQQYQVLYTYIYVLQSEANKGNFVHNFDQEVYHTRSTSIIIITCEPSNWHTTLLWVYEKRMQISGIFPCKVQNPAQTRLAVSLTENISGLSWYVSQYITYRILYTIYMSTYHTSPISNLHSIICVILFIYELIEPYEMVVYLWCMVNQ